MCVCSNVFFDTGMCCVLYLIFRWGGRRWRKVFLCSKIEVVSLGIGCIRRVARVRWFRFRMVCVFLKVSTVLGVCVR